MIGRFGSEIMIHDAAVIFNYGETDREFDFTWGQKNRENRPLLGV